MTETAQPTGVIAELRRIFWPIEWHENKKFIPMALMMTCILFNYAVVRSIKDGLIVTHIGAEAIGFLKTYFVLPSAIVMVVIYAKLCNIMSQQKVFYTITSFFVVYFIIFAFLIYPNPEMFHPSMDSINILAEKYPNFQWFIKIGGKWSYASFYIIAEMWGSMMLSLLFWQFANQITKTNEAKRFYSMFGLVGNLGLPLVFVSFYFLLNENTPIVSKEFELVPVLSLVSVSGLLILFLYRWINLNVLTDPELYQPKAAGSKKKKPKLNLSDSFKMIFSSKYLGLLVILIIAYGSSISLVEGVWKSKIKELYPSVASYTSYMGKFQAYQGFTAIFFMLVGANILRRVSWATAAMFTPVMILITGLAFFYFIVFDQSSTSIEIAAFFGTGPLMMVVTIGMMQNVLSKATKYSLFDSTKEMAYIPLDDEMKSKGKAAVDVIGGRFGKSAGGLIQSTFFFIFHGYSFVDATPYFGAIFLVIVILWLVAVMGLSKEYTQKIAENEAEEAA